MFNTNQKIIKTLDLESVFVLIGVTYVICFILSATFVIFSMFNKTTFYVFFILLILGLIYLLIKWRIKLEIEKIDLVAFVVVIFFGITSFIFFHHTLYGVRDEGVYANSAIGVITKGSIYIKDFINFPGWEKHGSVFIPQFLFGTTSWIALNYALFGLKGIYLSNVIPIIIGGLSYYYISKPYLRNTSIYLLFCFFTSYTMIWFTRRTVSEIIFFSLLWFSFYLIKKVYLNKGTIYFLLLILTCSSYILVRGEGMIYMFLTFILLFILNWKRKIVYIKYVGPGLVSLVPFVYYTIFIDNGYLLQLQHFAVKILTKIPGIHLTSKFMVDSSSQILYTKGSLYFNILPYTLNVLSQYDLLFFIGSVLLCLFWSFSKYRRNIDKILLLSLIIINLPILYSFFDFTIAPDQPWFLRRYLFSIIPLSYLCGFIFIHKYIKNYQVKNLIFISLILINLLISSPILTFSEYKEMPSNIDNISNNFRHNDVIFIDPYATGWYRLATELYFRKGLNAYYISTDISQNVFRDLTPIQLNKYNNVYILVNKKSLINEELNTPLFTYMFDLPIKYTTLISTTDLFHLDNIPNYNILNLKYDEIKPLISVPTEQFLVVTTLSIYKVSNKKDFMKLYGFKN